MVHRHRFVYAVPHLLPPLPPANLPATHRTIRPPRCLLVASCQEQQRWNLFARACENSAGVNARKLPHQ